MSESHMLKPDEIEMDPEMLSRTGCQLVESAGRSLGSLAEGFVDTLG